MLFLQLTFQVCCSAARRFRSLVRMQSNRLSVLQSWCSARGSLGDVLLGSEGLEGLDTVARGCALGCQCVRSISSRLGDACMPRPTSAQPTASLVVGLSLTSKRLPCTMPTSGRFDLPERLHFGAGCSTVEDGTSCMKSSTERK